MRTTLKKLQDLCALSPSRRRTERARAILLQAPAIDWDTCASFALSAGLLSPSEIRYVRLVLRALGTNPRWAMLALDQLEATSSLPRLTSSEDGDEDEGTVWRDVEDSSGDH